MRALFRKSKIGCLVRRRVHHHGSANTSTTNAPIKNPIKGGDLLRRNVSPTNRIKNLNWFCIAGCKIIVTGITSHRSNRVFFSHTDFHFLCGLWLCCVVLELRCRVFKRYAQNRRVFKRFSHQPTTTEIEIALIFRGFSFFLRI